jgi:hypothetical protein
MGEEAQRAEDNEMFDEMERERAQWAARIAERRQHIKDMARCTSCGASRKTCDNLREANTDPSAPLWFGCCAVGTLLGPCQHRESVAMVDALVKEVMAGEVRSVAEAYPPPVLGPARVSMTWLLDQKVWWYPQDRPAERVAAMDRPHRWNVARWLERRAPQLNAQDQTRGIWATAPDDVFGEVMRRDPMEFLAETPLYRALTRGLPPVDSKAGRTLAARALHWNTCPMRLKHPAPADTCVCIRKNGRIVGASNDPASVARLAVAP